MTTVFPAPSGIALSGNTTAGTTAVPQPAAALPLTFSSTIGLFKPAAALAPALDTAVLFVSSWGFEEMCTRRFVRIIADDLAERGIASLRFDYPGTGDSLDDIDLSAGLAVWEDSILAAADRLRAHSGATRLIVVAQGLGVPLALSVAGRLGPLDGIALLAPVVSGRAYGRELSVWATMIDNNLGLREEQRDRDGIAIAGLRMPEPIAAAVRRINIAAIDDTPAVPVLVMGRQGRPADSDLAARLAANGATVEQQPFEGYEQLISNLTYATVPMAAVANIVDWVTRTATAPAARPHPTLPLPDATPLQGDGFTETPVRFGAHDRLYGILCQPDGPRRGATVVIATTAYERQASWGRLSVRLARNLARHGIPSLRFDAANVGDSPAYPGALEQVLYSDDQNRDVAEALAFVEQQAMAPAIIAGRCSGGYLAFRGAVTSPGFSGVVSVNPYDLYWKPGQSVEDLLKFVPGALTSYGFKAFRADTWKRIARGEIRLKNAVVNIGRTLAQKALVALGKRVPFLPLAPKDIREVDRAFTALKNRHVAVSLVYSENDVGLRSFSHYFGADGHGLARHANARLTMIPDADHNLTPAHARTVYIDEVRKMALQFPPAT